MLTKRKLDGGGDTEFEKMMSNSNLVGVDIIELMWIPRNRLPFYGTTQVSGYQVPVITTDSISFDDNGSVSQWIDGSCKFFSDEAGRCWGYIYDTEYNRDLLASSLTNNWFRIVDKKVRDEIIELAQEKGWGTSPAEQTEIQIKISKREKEADNHAKELQKKLDEAKQKQAFLERELELAKGEKTNYAEKRLKGIKVPNRDAILEENK